jgi:rRNA biogenesis protein RRP5
MKPTQTSDSFPKHVELTIRESVLNRGLTIESIKPGMKLTGAVKSVEDHGYIISLGTSACTGFVRKEHAKSTHRIQRESKNVESEESDSFIFQVGQPIQGIVVQVDTDTKTVFIDTDPAKLATKVARFFIKIIQ